MFKKLKNKYFGIYYNIYNMNSTMPSTIQNTMDYATISEMIATNPSISNDVTELHCINGIDDVERFTNLKKLTFEQSTKIDINKLLNLKLTELNNVIIDNIDFDRLATIKTLTTLKFRASRFESYYNVKKLTSLTHLQYMGYDPIEIQNLAMFIGMT